MQHRGRGDGHLGRDLGVGGEEPKVVKHGMVLAMADLALHLDAVALGDHARELDAGVPRLVSDTLQLPEIVVAPVAPAQLAVGDEPEARFLLLGDDLDDLGVLDGGDFVGCDFARVLLLARRLDGRGSEEAADVIGAERSVVAGHGCDLGEPRGARQSQRLGTRPGPAEEARSGTRCGAARTPACGR